MTAYFLSFPVRKISSNQRQEYVPRDHGPILQSTRAEADIRDSTGLLCTTPGGLRIR